MDKHSLHFNFSSLENSYINNKKDKVYPVIETINDWLIEQNVTGLFGEPWPQSHHAVKGLLKEIYSENFYNFSLDDFVDLLRALPWVYPDDVRLLIDIYGDEPEDHCYVLVDIWPNLLMLGYFGEGKLPYYYLEDFSRKAYSVLNNKSQTKYDEIEKTFIQLPPPPQRTNKRQLTFVVHPKVKAVLLDNNILSVDEELTIINFSDGEFVCKVVLEDNLTGDSPELIQRGLEVSPIYYYYKNNNFVYGENSD